MRLYRIGDKVVSREKLLEVVDGILADRRSGATQAEAASRAGVQRSFVSILESAGEVRRGPKVALVAFPVSNADELRALAEARAVDFTLVFSQAERESIESGPAGELFNKVLEILATLKDYDVIVLMASDWRIRLVERILGRDVIGIALGASPLRADVEADATEVAAILDAVTAPAGERPRRERARDVLRAAAERAAERAAELPGRWERSSK
ncbi:MAG: transcriptional regulator [Coriobacteriia bacterium]|nr:transcriptional regulator [Coriobacteriia bacterium]